MRIDFNIEYQYKGGIYIYIYCLQMLVVKAIGFHRDDLGTSPVHDKFCIIFLAKPPFETL